MFQVKDWPQLQSSAAVGFSSTAGSMVSLGNSDRAAAAGSDSGGLGQGNFAAAGSSAVRLKA
jgi:hypothetical protein